MMVPCTTSEADPNIHDKFAGKIVSGENTDAD